MDKQKYDSTVKSRNNKKVKDEKKNMQKRKWGVKSGNHRCRRLRKERQ